MSPLDSPTLTAGEAAAQAADRLRKAGLPEARREAELLVRGATGLTREEFLAHPETRLTPAAQATLADLVARRASREPLPYILGRAEFYSRSFVVTRAVLIPRPETELLVEEVVARARAIEARVLVEVGAGSGAVAVVLAQELPRARVIAVEVSAEALAVARANCARHGVTARVDLVQGDLLGAIGQPVDVVAANLPYIRSEDLAALQPEVRDFEPRGALDGGYDGLAVIRRLVGELAPHLKPGGLAALEVGAGQAEEVAELLSAAGLEGIEKVRDYAGHDRVVLGWKGGGDHGHGPTDD